MEAVSGALWKLKKCDTTVNTGEDKTHECTGSKRRRPVCRPVCSPENKDQVFFLGLLGFISGVVEGVATVVTGQHLYKLQVGVLDRGADVPAEDLLALLQNDVLFVGAYAEQDSLLPLLLVLLVRLCLAHLHVIEDRDNVICDCDTGGLYGGKAFINTQVKYWALHAEVEQLVHMKL